MTRDPAVTLMVVTYNHERYVDQCLASVAAQTFRDLEVVVIDDASVDGTVDRIRPWLAKIPFETRLIVNERNLGICATRNRVVGAARGTFLSALSGDDFYEPDKIDRQHRVLSELDESVVAVFSNMRVVDDECTPTSRWYEDGRPPAEGRIFDRLVESNFIPAPTVLVRRAAVLGVGGYDESLFYEDYDMWLRLADRYEFHFVPGDVVNYRWTGNSASRGPRNLAHMHESRARLLMKWADRDPRTAAIVRDRAWRNARRAFAYDARLGRPVLRAAAGEHPSAAQRALLAATAVPGTDRVLRAALDGRDRRKDRRREPEAPRRSFLYSQSH